MTQIEYKFNSKGANLDTAIGTPIYQDASEKQTPPVLSFRFPCNRDFHPGTPREAACPRNPDRVRRCFRGRRNLEFCSIPESCRHTSETHQPRSDELRLCCLLTPHACCRPPSEIRISFQSLALDPGIDDCLVEHRPNSLVLAVSRMKTRLRVLRAEKEWSQADLADAVGVTRQCINAVETGKYEPGLDLAFKIARIFGKNVEEVFLYEESETSSQRQ